MPQSHYPEPVDDHVRRIVAWLDPNRREAYEERAAIMEWEARGVSRREAEGAALLDILATTGLPCPVHLLRVEMVGATDWVLTTDVEAAKATLTNLGGKHIVEVPVEAVVYEQYGDLAVLGTAPW